MNQSQLVLARDELVSIVEKELLGPGSEYSIPDAEHEIITDLPEIRYSLGILFPQKNKQNVDNDNIYVQTEIDKQEAEIDLDDNDIEDAMEDDDDAVYSDHNSEFTESNTIDEELTLSTQNMPSSMGLTFFVKKWPNKLIFNVKFGTYRRIELDECMVPFIPDNIGEYELPEGIQPFLSFFREDKVLKIRTKFTSRDIKQLEESGHLNDALLKEAMYRLYNQSKYGFIRTPHDTNVEITMVPNKNYYEVQKIDECEVKLTVSIKKYLNDIHAVTAILVNTHIGSYNGENSIFQPVITISTEKNEHIRFEKYHKRSYDFTLNDIEEESLDLLYRNNKIYASGHGVSVNWEIDRQGRGIIRTDFMPKIMVPQIDFNIKNKGVPNYALSMKYLSDLVQDTREHKLTAISSLVDAYSDWIRDLETKTENLDKTYLPSAKRHIDQALEVCKRMYKGIQLLRENDNVYNAFLLANRAMFMQRIHSDIQKTDRYPDDIKFQEEMASLNYYEWPDDDTKWRPFQLAFLLMSLSSIVFPEEKERDIVDLIWFPTGGGKTEAYLGLTAFTIFYRRLAYPETSGGTAAIMRYTLRLLTSQQFIRASILICACEVIRDDCMGRSKYPKYPLGKEKITIGLWIGGSHTPNRNQDAIKCVTNLRQATWNDIDEVKEKCNRFQILKCPWCGTKLVKERKNGERKLIGEWGYELENKKRFYLRCTQENCAFETMLPIQVVDEELYKSPPTLLFATVDKFAMLPWKQEIGNFFAVNNNNRTPELIIQDELHLISGPVGSIVGLYEAVIDELCSSKGIKPKIIASTATIRRAKDQCSSLYNREVRQFPSPGLDAGDSFFAKEAPVDEKPGRLYIGIFPSGKTKVMMEIRSIATILQHVHMMDIPDEVKDKLWTLVVYFNSLRDLGKCNSLINDDVKDFMKRIVYRLGTKNYRMITSADELTSRVSTSDLISTLEKLGSVSYSEKNIKEKNYPINVLLASNMISVGVDVDRLNVMLMVGQPMLTSEYIQASSRIGRKYPGVVFTLYDPSKSRDRSHFEQFRAYHESFYRYVEPTGVTPFSISARERGLHAVLISLMRHKYGLSKEEDASKFDRNSDAVNEIRDFLIKRIKEISARSDYDLTDVSDEIENEIEEFWDDWHMRVKISGSQNLYYGEKFMSKHPSTGEIRLMKPYGSENSDVPNPKDTLTSMRNVDKNITAGMIIWED